MRSRPAQERRLRVGQPGEEDEGKGRKGWLGGGEGVVGRREMGKGKGKAIREGVWGRGQGEGEEGKGWLF